MSPTLVEIQGEVLLTGAGGDLSVALPFSRKGGISWSAEAEFRLISKRPTNT